MLQGSVRVRAAERDAVPDVVEGVESLVAAAKPGEIKEPTRGEAG